MLPFYMNRNLVLSASIALSLAMSACSAPKQMAVESPKENLESADEQKAESREKELEELYWNRKAEAMTHFVKADVDFMSGMIGHHAQALIMSELAPKNGASAAVRRLASRIINAQNDEIAFMQKWLKDRGQKVPQVHIMDGKLMIHGGVDHLDHSKMPGMLSDAQLVELAAARDVEFDRLFLTYMIQHHSGAITMVDELFSTDGSGQDEASFKIASDINVDQITEIERMKLMLSQIPVTI